MNHTLEALGTIQWMVGNALLTAEEESLLKSLAFNAPADTTEHVLGELKHVQWLVGNKRLTPGEVRRLKDQILAPYRATPPSTAGQQTIRLAAPGAAWEYLVVAWSELGLAGDPAPAGLQSSLAGYGADGWELAGVIAPPGGSGQPWLVFKRPGRTA